MPASEHHDQTSTAPDQGRGAGPARERPVSDRASTDRADTPSSHYARDLDLSIAAMRALLARTHPTSDAEALKTLRDAFPATSLETRVAALRR